MAPAGKPLSLPGHPKISFEEYKAQIEDHLRNKNGYTQEEIAGLVKKEELNERYIIPSIFHPKAAKAVTEVVCKTAIKEGLSALHQMQ